MSNVRPRMNHANTRSSAARCAARALARSARCRRRLAVGAVGQGPMSKHVTVAGAGCPSFGGQRTVEARRTEDQVRGFGKQGATWKNTNTKRLGRYRGCSRALRIRAAPSRQVSLGASHAARAASVGMLRHPNANTSTSSRPKQSRYSPSVA